MRLYLQICEAWIHVQIIPQSVGRMEFLGLNKLLLKFFLLPVVKYDLIRDWEHRHFALFKF